MADGVALSGVTGVGSLPGTDIDAALAAVFDDWPELPYLPELPARGPAAAMIGRTAAALADLHVDLQPSGWRLVARGGVDERRATELLDRDLDALLVRGAGYGGPLKLQLAGPWTLAANVELPRGGVALRDAGAVRDLADALAETARELVADVRRRVPGAQPILQLDEPALPAVLSGAIPTESRFSTLPATEPATASALLRRVVEVAEVDVVVHCCAAQLPVGVVADAGAAALSFDATVAAYDEDELAERWERGLALWPGVLPAVGPVPAADAVVSRVRDLARRLGAEPAAFAARSVLTPTCGLAGSAPDRSREAAGTLRRAMEMLTETRAVLPR